MIWSCLVSASLAVFLTALQSDVFSVVFSVVLCCVLCCVVFSVFQVNVHCPLNNISFLTTESAVCDAPEAQSEIEWHIITAYVISRQTHTHTHTHTHTQLFTP